MIIEILHLYLVLYYTACAWICDWLTEWKNGHAWKRDR